MLVLFVMEDNGTLLINTADSQLKPKPGQAVIAMVKSDDSEANG